MFSIESQNFSTWVTRFASALLLSNFSPLFQPASCFYFPTMKLSAYICIALTKTISEGIFLENVEVSWKNTPFPFLDGAYYFLMHDFANGYFSSDLIYLFIWDRNLSIRKCTIYRESLQRTQPKMSVIKDSEINKQN